MFVHVDDSKTLPDLQSKTLSNGRFYKVNNRWYPSVTTVVNQETAEGIKRWEKRVGLNEAEKIRKQSAWRGTCYHEMVEDYLNNRTGSKDPFPLVEYIFRSSKSTLDKINNIHTLESTLYSEKLSLAGRVDCIAEYNGELAVIDFKTTTKLKKVEWLENYFIQASAYAYMYWELTQCEVKKLVILSVADDGEVQVEERYDKVHYLELLIDLIKKFVSRYET